MLSQNQYSSRDSSSDIRIVSLNQDKTRRAIGQASQRGTDSLKGEAEYQVYFELSGTPSQAWRNIFEREWMAMTPPELWQKASVDNRFLVVHCLLQDISSTYLPVLKKVLAATNTAFHEYTQQQTTAQKQREDAWELERKAVCEMAESLHFQ